MDCGHGHQAVFTGYRGKVIDTVLGPVTLRRAWYHCARCGHGLAPRDAELGAAGASMSPGLAAMNDKAAAAVPFAAGRGAAGGPGRDPADRQARRAGRRGQPAPPWPPRRAPAAGLIARRKLVPLPPSPLPDKLYTVIDGTGVPITAKETAGREGKGEDGRARTREVKMAVFFTQDKLDKTGYPVRDRASSSYIATFEPAAAFGAWSRPRASAAARTTSASSPSSATAPPGSGTSPPPPSPRPPTSSTSTTPASTCTPSPGRWSSCCGDRKDEWLAARLEDLDYGYIDGINAAVRKYPLEGVKKDEADKELGYFLNNAPRMRYHWFRSRGLFVGSGVVEAGCKAVIGQRLKQSGMHWTVNGADSIITLRCARPAASGKPSAATATTRQAPPDQPARKITFGHLQICRTPPASASTPECQTQT